MNISGKGILRRGLALGIGIGILVLLVYFAGFDRFINVLRRASPAWIAAAVMIYATSWIFRTWRLKILTGPSGKTLRAFALFKYHISGYALNSFLPAKLGDAATVVYLKMAGVNLGRAVAIIFQTRILDLLAIVLLSTPAVILVLGKSAPGWIVTTFIFCALIVAAPLAMVAFDRKRYTARIFEKLGKKSGNRMFRLAADKAGDTYQGYHEIVSDPLLLAGSILLSLAAWGVEGLAGFAVSRALGAAVSFLPVLLAVAIGNIGKAAPATPGSVGIYEGIFAAVLVLFAVPFEVAIAVAILDHLLKKLFNVTVGGAATLRIGVSLDQIRKMVDDQGR
ncbi:MAG: lysylphosphatidylglycerol synthase transmembrane domain-containing protein [bacterium]|nr:lysylphosphatidylglycerol synthase transmembrane domain-containing protein [bacterium]